MGGLPFLFSYASVLNTCISMYILFTCNSVYSFSIASDSEGETPKKKVKATPPKKAGKSKKGEKSSAPVVKKEIKNVSDFFGSAPIKRSSYSKSSGEKRKAEVFVGVGYLHRLTRR